MAENERDLLLTDGGEPQGSPSGGDRAQKLKKLLAGDVAKCIIVLAAIALVAGVLLGLMNWLDRKSVV